MRERKNVFLGRASLALLFLFLCASCSWWSRRPAIAQGSPAPGRTLAEKFEFGGLSRSYRLHVPGSYEGASARPLVFILHGYLGDARHMQEAFLGGRFDELSDAHGFFALYPDGVNRAWNDGGRLRPPKPTDPDDVGFLTALLDDLSAKYRVDPSRVYAAGISNGGMMAYRLACDAAGRFAAIAPVAASLSENFAPLCKPERPVSVMIVNGTKDSLIRWEGGDVRVFFKVRRRVLAAEATATFWTKANGCEGPARNLDLPDQDPEDGTRISLQEWEGCVRGTAVRLYKVDGGGHTWPGARQYLGQSLLGPTSRDLDASEAIWNFFEGHPQRD